MKKILVVVNSLHQQKWHSYYFQLLSMDDIIVYMVKSISEVKSILSEKTFDLGIISNKMFGNDLPVRVDHQTVGITHTSIFFEEREIPYIVIGDLSAGPDEIVLPNCIWRGTVKEISPALLEQIVTKQFAEKKEISSIVFEKFPEFSSLVSDTEAGGICYGQT